MKFLKKLNKGLILTIIVLVILLVYLFNLENSRKKAKPELEKICQSYVDLYNKYSMFDEKYRTIDKSITDDEYSKYLKLAKDDSVNIFVDDSNILDNQMQSIKQNLNTQLSGNYVLTDVKRTINKFSSFTFDSDTVTVVFKSYAEISYLSRPDSSYDKKSGKYLGTAEKKSNASEMSDTISLKKVDDNWKIVSVSMYMPSSDSASTSKVID